VVWILRDGDTVLFSAISTRRKVLNLTRDPRISLTVFARSGAGGPPGRLLV
jgi:hypothetical protein